VAVFLFQKSEVI